LHHAFSEKLPALAGRGVTSRDLLKRSFKFVGPTICYAFMQAVGMVNDHTVDCFRYEAVKQSISRSGSA
jgi:DNA-3-methyladenine glycosylase I